MLLHQLRTKVLSNKMKPCSDNKLNLLLEKIRQGNLKIPSDSFTLELVKKFMNTDAIGLLHICTSKGCHKNVFAIIISSKLGPQLAVMVKLNVLHEYQICLAGHDPGIKGPMGFFQIP